MTGRINYTLEAQQHLNELDDWITKAASAEVAWQKRGRRIVGRRPRPTLANEPSQVSSTMPTTTVGSR